MTALLSLAGAAMAVELQDGTCTNGASSVNLPSDWAANALVVTVQLNTAALADVTEWNAPDLFSLQTDAGTVYQFGLSGSTTLSASFSNIGSVKWADETGSSDENTPVPTLEALQLSDVATVTLVVGYDLAPGIGFYGVFFGSLTLSNGTSYYMTGSPNGSFNKIPSLKTLTINSGYVNEGWIQAIDPNMKTDDGTKGGYDAFRPVIENLNSTAVSYTPAVPEPATTTLSLLALSGLMIRRRRK